MQWLRDELCLIRGAGEVGEIAASVPDNGGVYLVPAFTGLGAPYWDMYARGAIVGLTRGSTRAHIVRAAEEAIAYQSADLVAAMEKDTGLKISELRVDGGASRDGFLMQFQADVLGRTVRRGAVCETTALGAASLAGLAAGIWSGISELREIHSSDVSFTPDMDSARRAELLNGWHRAVERSLAWEK